MTVDARDALIGEWDLMTYKVLRRDGTEVEPLGANPIGVGVYTQHGTMIAQLMRRGRQHFEQNRQSFSDPHAVEPERILEAFNGYIAYSGTYEIIPETRTVEHHVQCSLFPNWEGTVLTRSYTFNGDVLVLRPPPASETGQQAELVWRRRTPRNA